MRSPARCRSIWPRSRSASTRRARRSSSRTSGRPPRKSTTVVRKNITRKMFAKKYADVFKGDANWRKITVKGGMTYAWDSSRPTCRTRRISSACRRRRRRSTTSSTRACWPVPRFDHHRPHLAGRLDQGVDSPAGKYLRRSQGEAGRLQPVRHAPRQSRSDDARHLRQHPHQEPDGAGRRRRRHDPLSRRSSRCRSTTRRCTTRPRRSRW